MTSDDLYEIVLMPTSGTTGHNLVVLINSLPLISQLPTCVVADIECNDNRRWTQLPPFLSTMQEVLEYSKDVGQYDWATFFFFRNRISGNATALEFNALFKTAIAIIRAVDDTYFYVYLSDRPDESFISEHKPLELQRQSRHTIVHPY